MASNKLIILNIEYIKHARHPCSECTMSESFLIIQTITLVNINYDFTQCIIYYELVILIANCFIFLSGECDKLHFF